MTFHPRRFLWESGLHLAGRSFPVMAGGILVFVGGLLTTIGLAAWSTEAGRTPDDGLGMVLVLGFTGSVLIAGLIVLARGLGQVAAAVRLAREGARAEGTVVAVRASRMTVNHRVQVIVRFRYRDAKGGVHEGDSWPTEPSEGWSPGDRGVVRYDPEKPAAALWVGRRER